MQRLFIENFRCFKSLVDVPLAPLTLLVGENSTGKSTFMAAARAATRLMTPQLPEFNEPPFSFGGFEHIVARIGKDAPPSFRIGTEVGFRKRAKSKKTSVQVIAEYGKRGTDPACISWELKHKEISLRLRYPQNKKIHAQVKSPEGDVAFSLDLPAQRTSIEEAPWILLSFLMYQQQQQQQLPTKRLDEVRDMLLRLQQNFPIPYALAPIRTHPHRTYDPVSSTPAPEGAHIPVVLARTWALEEERAQKIKMELQEFGRNSGLFKAVSVKRLGRSDGAPFQIHVKVHRRLFNLVDVGYGVSQVLPIIVDCVSQERVNDLILLQQPEVHLHPRAQAELGTFFGRLVATASLRFLIETHSDYLLDRILMDIRDKRYGLQPEDVLVLFFRHTESGVVVSPIGIDERGRIRDVPPGYRDFFLMEESRFLGMEG